MIYSDYTTSQGVLHDSDELSVIYTVIDLIQWNHPDAWKINERLINLARNHYKDILTDLNSGKKPKTNEEKRIASLIKGTAKLNYKKAGENIRLQIGQKDRFLEGYIRSGAYIDIIKNIFKSYNLPEELVYLPHVESSFNPEAHSKAGAAGLWQFTHSTGRRYMKVNNVVDYRYDPHVSTRAAAKLLKENYEKLNSWPLAITAYNYGQAGMWQAFLKEKTFENIFLNHKAGRFKFAARNFYAEFLAAMNVAKRLEKDKSIIMELPTATFPVKLQGYASAKKLSRHFEISLKDFSKLNPSLRSTVLEEKKFIPQNFLLRLPETKRTKNLAAKIPNSFFHAQQIRDKTYIVRKGDTVSKISSMYQLRTAELIAFNNLDNKATIRVGQRLKIPSPSKSKKKENIIHLYRESKQKPN